MSKFIKHGDLRINLEKFSEYYPEEGGHMDCGNYHIEFCNSNNSSFKILFFQTKEKRDEFLAKIDKLVGVENE